MSAHRLRRRAGFTLVETLATLALLCFVVAVLGPLLMRVSRQSSSVTIGQYRTAVLVSATSWASSLSFGLLGSTCITSTTPAFNYSTCTQVTDTLAALRRVRIIVTPQDSVLSAPDTVTVYRVNSGRINPFDAP